MDAVTANDLIEIIGKEMKDASVQRVLAKITVPVKVKKREDKKYHQFNDFGLEIVETRGRVSTVFLKSKSRACAEFAGEAPENLAMSMGRNDVRNTLGEPDKENGTSEDQWDRGLYRLGVKFSDKGKVDFVYLSAR